MAWQDNNTVLLMITAHSAIEVSEEYPKKPLSRHHIPKDSLKTRQNGTEFLSFPGAILDYNANMGGCDGNAQQREYSSSSERRSCRY